MFKKLKSSWPPLAIILLCAIISYLNYEPNTYLTGWDNLHPEFDFTLNLKRSLFSVWQEHQGLGLLGGMAHGADLIRQTFLFLLQFTGIPQSLIRYSYAFIILPIGPLGIYFLTKNLILSNHFDRQTRHSASFLGAIFYLLNLVTIQHYYVPFETFITFHQFFPWLIYLTLKYLKEPTRKHFLIMTTIYLISAPSFYVETLFIVLLISLIPIIHLHLRDHRLKPKSIITSFSSLLTLLITQGYWLFPVIFFALTNSKVGQEAHVNLVTSPETYDRNLAFASFQNLIFLKGYLFNFFALDPNQKFNFLLSNWREHLSNPLILIIGSINFLLILTGIYYSLKKRLHHTQSLLFILLICYFFLLGGSVIINNHLPLVGELFRSPFTKFSTPLSLSYSIFFAVGTIFLLDLFSFLHIRLTSYITLFSICLGLFIFSAPVFTGNLISPLMKRQIPTEYFELFDFMKTKDLNTRIANFPQPGFIGWHFYRWGYQGSGFLWYGINQPILDRNFDVWEKQNEKYYEKLNAAIYSENITNFENTLSEYQITWLVFDKYLISPNNPKALAEEKINRLINTSSQITLENNINDKILIYKHNLNQNTQNFLTITPSNNLTPKPIYIPNLRPQTDWQISKDNLNLSINIPNKNTNRLIIPSYTHAENLIPVSIAYRKKYQFLEFKITPLLPTINSLKLESSPSYIEFPLPEDETGFILQLNNEFIELQIPSELTTQDDYLFLTTTHLPTKKLSIINLYSSTPLTNINLTPFITNQKPQTCYLDKPNRHIEKITTQNSITLIGTDVVGCISLPLETTNDLISISFQIASPTNTPGHVNITNSNFEGLLTNLIPQTSNQIPKQHKIFSPGELKNLQLNLILEANETKSSQEITYKNITLTTHRLIDSKITDIKPSKPLPVSLKNSSLTISIPVISSPLTYHLTPDNNILFPEARNCNPVNNNYFEKIISPNLFTYKAKNASTCDFANFSNLTHSSSYTIIFSDYFSIGLPLSICFENYATGRCDIHERLPKNQTPKTISLISPITNQDEIPGYTLHLINDSFSQQLTKNSFSNLTITPFPINFLKNITTIPTSEIPNTTNATIQSNHPAEFIYLAKIDVPQEEKQIILNLYQTHSPFWIALFVPEDFANISLLKQIITLPKILYQHPKLAENAHQDEWHNSWKIPSGINHLAIVYIPQYLQFFGFALLPLLLITFLLHSSGKPKKHKPIHHSLFKRKTKKSTKISQH